uniref:Mitotic checkpoint protein BUB3 n=1 Tax=Globodera rostochiensis TaxID=31243 RepID=A0A914HJ19_GLORO
MNAHYVASANEFPVPFKTAYGISKVQFSPDVTRRLIAVSTWDTFVKIFDVTNPGAPMDMRTYYHTKSVLCCTFVDAIKVVSGGLDEVVKVCDLESGRETVMGQHTDGVRCMEFCATMRVAVSGGWDNLMKLWDIRALMPVGAMECGDRVYALDVVDNRAVVGTKDRRVIVWDVRNMKAPLQTRESPLKFQTRSIKCFPSGEAFVLSSIEGRVAVEYFDQDVEVQKGKYAFKCHRVKEETGELIYPVNAVAFHPVHRTFATGGSDNIVNMWDPFNRKRLCQFRKFPSSIVSLSFSPDGGMLAIASTYMYEEERDPNPVPESSLTIRRMTELEVRPK